MLPNPQHPPAGAAEGAGDETVAGLVTGDLGPPELRVGLGPRGVDRTPVPETSVHEDGEFMFGENEVGLPEDHRLPPPAGDAMRLEYPHQPQLGALVARTTDERHHVRAFSFGKNIGHGAVG